MGPTTWPRLLLLVLMHALPAFAYQETADDFINANNTSTAEEITARKTTSDTKPPMACPPQTQWKKNLVITSMRRTHPSTSNAGNFYHADQYIPQMLAKELQKQIGMKSRFIEQTTDLSMNEFKKQNQARVIALQQDTQFVLQGEILDMSMRESDTAYNPGITQSLLNTLNNLFDLSVIDNRDRLFSLHLELRDGFTGDLLFEDTFSTHGIWKNPETTGFQSSKVWKSNYGKKIEKLIRKASRSLANNVQCQAYMARTNIHPGQSEVLIQGGTNNGIRKGDRLNLYQLVNQASITDYDHYQTRLINRGIKIRISEAYPSHSLAQLEENNLLTGSFLAVGED